MIDTTPKGQFLRLHNEHAVSLRKVVSEPWFREAMTYATAQMMEGGATAEEIKGARKYRDTLAALGDPVDAPPSPPDKSNPEYEEEEV